MKCVGCAGVVPDFGGPIHPYMRSSPGCWQLFSEIGAYAHGAAVDCYAAQHPGGAEHDRRQRQSVAVHLTALCLRLERGVPAARLAAIRGRLSRTVLPRIGHPDWPYLEPPTSPGGVTVVDVHRGLSEGAQIDGVPIDEWADAVWTTWTTHHETVRRWASAALGGSA